MFLFAKTSRPTLSIGYFLSLWSQQPQQTRATFFFLFIYHTFLYVYRKIHCVDSLKHTKPFYFACWKLLSASAANNLIVLNDTSHLYTRERARYSMVNFSEQTVCSFFCGQKRKKEHMKWHGIVRKKKTVKMENFFNAMHFIWICSTCVRSFSHFYSFSFFFCSFLCMVLLLFNEMAKRFRFISF